MSFRPSTCTACSFRPQPDNPRYDRLPSDRRRCRNCRHRGQPAIATTSTALSAADATAAGNTSAAAAAVLRCRGNRDR